MSFGRVDREGLIDREGLFAWPEPGAPMATELAVTMQAFNELDMQRLTQITRQTGGEAHKIVEQDKLTPEGRRRWEQIAPRFGDDVQAELFEFTYCLRTGDARRIWAAFIRGTTLHPIWWDPNHEVCRPNPKYADYVAGGPCQDDCLHPDRMGNGF